MVLCDLTRRHVRAHGKVGAMKSPMLRFFLVTMLLLLLGVVACRKYAQDECIGKSSGDSCEIDRGCNEPADPGVCKPQGTNDILDCTPI